MLFVPAGPGKPFWLRFIKRVALYLTVGVVPLFVFLFSALLTPGWQGVCSCGWVSGFIVGKLALTPVVIYAILGLYRLERIQALDPEEPRPTWVFGGVFCGACTSSICMAFAFLCPIKNGLHNESIILAVMSYVPIWYVWRAIQLAPSALSQDFVLPAVGMFPLWMGSWAWSYYFYVTLPASPPTDCFVVTVASHGHSILVGPQFWFLHKSEKRLATRQLIRFWQFEDVWRSRSPRSHFAFRAIYNRVGPRLAARVTSPWRADLVFVALLPFEWIVRLASSRPACELAARDPIGPANRTTDRPNGL